MTKCECCEMREGVHWMEWGEWLCDDCMTQAIAEDDEAGK